MQTNSRQWTNKKEWMVQQKSQIGIIITDWLHTKSMVHELMRMRGVKQEQCRRYACYCIAGVEMFFTSLLFAHSIWYIVLLSFIAVFPHIRTPSIASLFYNCNKFWMLHHFHFLSWIYIYAVNEMNHKQYNYNLYKMFCPQWPDGARGSTYFVVEENTLMATNCKGKYASSTPTQMEWMKSQRKIIW